MFLAHTDSCCSLSQPPRERQRQEKTNACHAHVRDIMLMIYYADYREFLCRLSNPSPPLSSFSTAPLLPSSSLPGVNERMEGSSTATMVKSFFTKHVDCEEASGGEAFLLIAPVLRLYGSITRQLVARSRQASRGTDQREKVFPMNHRHTAGLLVHK